MWNSTIRGLLHRPTWRACRGSGRARRGWPCSTRCCSRSASGWEPWRRGSDSCHSRGCAVKRKRERVEVRTEVFMSGMVTEERSPFLLTILCLYSSEASCTAVSQALEPLAYTLLTSSIQYLSAKKSTEHWSGVRHTCMETASLNLSTVRPQRSKTMTSSAYFVGRPNAMLSSCETRQTGSDSKQMWGHLCTQCVSSMNLEPLTSVAFTTMSHRRPQKPKHALWNQTLRSDVATDTLTGSSGNIQCCLEGRSQEMCLILFACIYRQLCLCAPAKWVRSCTFLHRYPDDLVLLSSTTKLFEEFCPFTHTCCEQGSTESLRLRSTSYIFFY